MVLRPKSAEDIQEAVRAHPKLHMCGAGTKTGLRVADADADATTLDISQLSGVLEYDPQEFVLTAYAGTPVAQIEKLLAEQGQYLPFDPLLSKHGATLGGTVAANASGPGRFRYGGVRDFLIGAKFVDGTGTLLRGGGKVVKNAAGFDYPKLMVGALGRLGVLVELTFKVFPKPEQYMTLRVEQSSLADAISTLYKLNTTPLDVEALDMAPSQPSSVLTGEGFAMWVRIGGLASGLKERIERIERMIGAGEAMRGEDDIRFWQSVREFDWATSGEVTKIPITPERIKDLEQQLGSTTIARRYSVGGNVAYVAAPFASQDFGGFMLLGKDMPVPMQSNQHAFAQRIKQALDPQHKFV